MTEHTDVGDKMYEARYHTRAAAKSVADLAWTMMLAGIGAVALVKDETRALLNKMVERGATAEHEARRTADELAARSRAASEPAQSMMERQVEGVLGRMNIPTRADIAALNTKISVLSAKMDALMAQENPPLPPETPPTPPEDQAPVA